MPFKIWGLLKSQDCLQQKLSARVYYIYVSILFMFKSDLSTELDPNCLFKYQLGC